MNTLNKGRTCLILGEPTVFAALERQWKIVTNGPQHKALRAEHYLLYAALRGKDWRRGFAPITNPRKLENGAFYDWGAYHALRRIRFDEVEALLAPFNGVVDAAVVERLRAFLPKFPQSFESEAYNEDSNG